MLNHCEILIPEIPEPSNKVENLAALLEWREHRQSEKQAFDFLDHNLNISGQENYGSLGLKARVIARHLIDQGVEHEPVILAYPPGLDFVCGLWGIIAAGAIAVPAYPPADRQKVKHLNYIAKDSSANFLLAPNDIIERYKNITNEQAGKTILHCLSIDTLQDIKPIDHYISNDAHATAIIQYTSGSTSEPKGVALSHHNILHNSQLIHHAFIHSSKSRGLIWLPPYHDMGLIGGIIQPVYVGFPTTLMSPKTFLRDPMNWLKAISKTKATTTGGPNTAYKACLNIPAKELRKHKINLSNWQIAFNGAEPVDPDVLVSFATKFEPYGFLDRRFIPCYGLAESTLFVSSCVKVRKPSIISINKEALHEHKVEVRFPGKLGVKMLVGHGFADNRIKIVNPQTCNACPPNQIGEIWVTGDSVSSGFWGKKNKEKSAKFNNKLANDPSSYLRTGDLGFIRRGELYITGRISGAIIVYGKNFYPQDIEQSAVSAHSLLSETATAFSISADESDDAKQRVVIVQEISQQHSKQQDLQPICNAVRIAVAEQHGLSLSDVVLVKSGTIPKTGSGKLRRDQCKKAFLLAQMPSLYHWQQTLRKSDHNITKTDSRFIDDDNLKLDGLDKDQATMLLRDWMMRKVSADLQVPVEELNPDMHFGLYGLDSITAAEITAQMSVMLNMTFDDIIFWDFPNFNLLSAHIIESWSKHET